jgi:hypothetical protein
LFRFLWRSKESRRLLQTYGPDFERLIGEIDKLAVKHGASAADHVKRREVITYCAVGYVREHPDVEDVTVDMEPRERAMAAYTNPR